MRRQLPSHHLGDSSLESLGLEEGVHPLGHTINRENFLLEFVLQTLALAIILPCSVVNLP